MDAASWHRLEQWFAEAIELPAPRRAAFCDRVARDDAAIAAELRSLLDAHAAGDGVLDRRPLRREPAALPLSSLLVDGTRIGVWRIGPLIGRGGAGDVYLATRADGAFEQRAALKRLHRETAPEFARFQAERQILASLDHPGIARLLDGGVAADGRLYAVVEYVDGQPLTEHCRARGADLAERLALFLQVCDVVAYAHRNLIVHRDLKPGNILVTDEGRVKLLDFGVAKRIDRSTASNADRTAAPFTSDYAAPEQLTGQPITTATDVHALGVVLFELLTGTLPWRSEGLPIARVVRLIVHGDAPSLVAAASHGDAPVPPQRLAGDLEAIVATCLRKDAADRYPTVDRLMRDIERHLANEPVTARGKARSYVLGRAVRRYRWAVAGGALVFTTLTIGLGATIWQAHRAEIERDAARRAATREEAIRYQLTNLFRTSIAAKGGAPVTAKTMLDLSAKRVLAEYRDDPQLAGKVVVTLADLYGALEDVEGQGSLLENYLAAAGAGDDRESVALAQQKLALVDLLRGRGARAAELLPKAEAVWAGDPARFHEQHLEAMFVRGLMLRTQGDLDGSIATYRAAIAERTAASGRVHRETANLYNSLAITLTGAGRLDEALDAYKANLDIYARLGQSEDLDALVIAGNTGTLAYRTGRLREAEQILRTSFEKQRARAGDSAAVAASMGLYGASLTALGRTSEAVAALEPAVAMAARFVGAASPLAIQNRLFLTDALLEDGRLSDARGLSADNVATARRQLGDTAVLTMRARLTEARLDLADGRADAAARAYEASLAPLRKAGVAARPWLAHALVGRGEALLAEGRAADAVAPLQEAVALREQQSWSRSWELALARVRLGEAVARSHGGDGVRSLREGLAVLEEQLGERHPQVVRARAALAAAL